MRIRYSTEFKKKYKKLPKKIQEQFDKRLAIFVVNADDNLLRHHSLQGKYVGYWSINVNGDMRALYRFDRDRNIVFSLIGTHSQLY